MNIKIKASQKEESGGSKEEDSPPLFPLREVDCIGLHEVPICHVDARSSQNVALDLSATISDFVQSRLLHLSHLAKSWAVSLSQLCTHYPLKNGSLLPGYLFWFLIVVLKHKGRNVRRQALGSRALIIRMRPGYNIVPDGIYEIVSDLWTMKWSVIINQGRKCPSYLLQANLV